MKQKLDTDNLTTILEKVVNEDEEENFSITILDKNTKEELDFFYMYAESEEELFKKSISYSSIIFDNKIHDFKYEYVGQQKYDEHR